MPQSIRNDGTAPAAETSGSNRRREPRFRAQHRVEGEVPDGEVEIQGRLRDLSVGGCCLTLDRRIPLGTSIDIRCNISGIGLRIRGEVVWAEETTAGVLHGVALTGFDSDEDALFHRLYLQRLSRHQAEGAGCP